MTDRTFDPVRHMVGRLTRTFEGPMWHGASLREVLHDVDAQMAKRSDVAGVHSIWALVLHMTLWAEIALARIDGERLEYPPADVDWQAVPTDATAAAWKRDVKALGAAYAALAARAAKLSPDELLNVVEEQDYSIATMLDGVIEHGVWHGGQVALLKRYYAN